MNGKLPYSYHTFMYPFSYQEDIINEKNCNLWEEEPIPDKEGVAAKKALEKDVLLYNEYQYFLPQARKNIFNSDSEHAVSRHYSFKGIDPKEDNFYKIKIADEKSEKTYKLVINAIRLLKYPEFKIGILIFEMEYYTVPGSPSFSDVLEINDYGRRLFPPCIDKNLKSILTADEISIHIDNCLECSIRFNKDRYENEQEVELVKQILGIRGDEHSSIRSILDDRMFVACLVRDDRIANMPFLKKLNKDIEDSEQEDAKKIYEFIFVDEKDGCSCQSRRMLNRALQTHIYDRWADYGTFYGITEYSFVCATGEGDVVNAVINPFLTCYVDMAKLALAQRAALTKMENEIPEIPDEEVSRNGLDEIRKNWKNYVRFQSMLCLPEVTFQRQGVELYQILKEVFKINMMSSSLEKKLDNLHNIAELEYQVLEQKSDDRINDILNFMTAASLALALISMSQDFFFGINALEENAVNGLTGIMILLISAFLMWKTLRSSQDLSKTTGKSKEKKRNIKERFCRMTVIVYIFLFLLLLYKMVFLLKTFRIL